MRQISLVEYESSLGKKQTSKAKFLAKMKEIVPIEAMCDVIKPYYHVKDNGRQRIELRAEIVDT